VTHTITDFAHLIAATQDFTGLVAMSNGMIDTTQTKANAEAILQSTAGQQNQYLPDLLTSELNVAASPNGELGLAVAPSTGTLYDVNQALHEAYLEYYEDVQHPPTPPEQPVWTYLDTTPTASNPDTVLAFVVDYLGGGGENDGNCLLQPPSAPPPPVKTPELGSGELLATGLLPLAAALLYRRQRERRARKATTEQQPMA